MELWAQDCLICFCASAFLRCSISEKQGDVYLAYCGLQNREQIMSCSKMSGTNNIWYLNNLCRLNPEFLFVGNVGPGVPGHFFLAA